MSASLAAQQRALLAALWQPRLEDAIEIVAPHIDTARPEGHSVERGLQAYRSNAHALAPRALGSAYPVVAQLLGDNFAPLARLLWQQHPPRRGDLAQWGEALATLVESMPDLSEEEPFLADVARCEWALHRAASAADGLRDPSSFRLLSEGDPGRCTLQLCPGAWCMASAWPVVSVLHAHMTGLPSLEEAGALVRDKTPETAVVWREGMQPRVRRAAPGEDAFITALLSGQSLLEALDAAPDLDLDAWLAPAARSGLMLGVRPL